jgi:hypothetical protein
MVPMVLAQKIKSIVDGWWLIFRVMSAPSFPVSIAGLLISARLNG